MNNKIDLEALKEQYHSLRPKYERLLVEIERQLTPAFQQMKIHLGFKIEYRIKPWYSILGKIEKKGYTPIDISEINDLAGMRIICLFKEDVEKVKDTIFSYFDIINEEDTKERLTDNQFGYGSIHFEVRLLHDWIKLPLYRDLAGLQLEIQVRTASQHMWAAASHLLQYKEETDIPLPLRRTINRAAALLETVDLEFDRVLEEKREYIANLSGDLDEELNVINLYNFLFKKRIGKREIFQNDLSNLLSDLRNFGFNKLGDLKTLFEKHKKKLKKNEYNMTGVVRFFLSQEIGEDKFGEYIEMIYG